MDRESIAWAAGVFEGEGCWGSYAAGRNGAGRSTTAQVRVAMSDRDVVERFAKIVGVGRPVRERKVRPGEKPMFEWYAYGFEKVQAVIAMFWPFLGERRRAKAVTVLDATRHTQAMGDRPNCPQGHPYAGENLLTEVIRRGDKTYIARRCRVCRNRNRKAA